MHAGIVNADRLNLRLGVARGCFVAHTHSNALLTQRSTHHAEVLDGLADGSVCVSSVCVGVCVGSVCVGVCVEVSVCACAGVEGHTHVGRSQQVKHFKVCIGFISVLQRASCVLDVLCGGRESVQVR